MHAVPLSAALPYTAPGHNNMEMKRLQGLDAGPSDSIWIGLSTIYPGGGTTPSASTSEKFYVVLDGEVTVSNGSETLLLRPLDSCRFEPGEMRQLSNASDKVASILLIMPKT